MFTKSAAMNKVMKQVLLLTIVFCLLFTVCLGQENKLPNQSNSVQPNGKQLEDLRQRFSVKYAGILVANIWSLNHNYRSETESDDILKYFIKFFTAVESKDEAKIREMGGVKAFKEKIAEFLKSDDDAVKGFAATILSITGDTAYVPVLATLIEEKDESFTDPSTSSEVTYRGRAAMGLGILGAKEYTAKIALLLKSRNNYDRTGAVNGLSHLGAKEYAKDVVALLANKDFQHIDDVSPIYFLIETGTAKDYKKELVDVMLRDFGIETVKTATYAFVKLDSKENAKDIAKLLGKEFRKGDAAKALALLDAKEYTDKIALLLNDENSLVRKDAALALGVLKAKNHSSKIAELLKAKEDFVRYYAAVSLVLLEAKEYYKEAIPIIEKFHQSDARLNEGDFHALVLDQSRRIKADFKQLLEKAKSLNDKKIVVKEGEQ